MAVAPLRKNKTRRDLPPKKQIKIKTKTHRTIPDKNKSTGESCEWDEASPGPPHHKRHGRYAPDGGGSGLPTSNPFAHLSDKSDTHEGYDEYINDMQQDTASDSGSSDQEYVELDDYMLTPTTGIAQHIPVRTTVRSSSRRTRARAQRNKRKSQFKTLDDSDDSDNAETETHAEIMQWAQQQIDDLSSDDDGHLPTPPTNFATPRANTTPITTGRRTPTRRNAAHRRMSKQPHHKKPKTAPHILDDSDDGDNDMEVTPVDHLQPNTITLNISSNTTHTHNKRKHNHLDCNITPTHSEGTTPDTVPSHTEVVSIDRLSLPWRKKRK
jgi:hypothetical protein